MWESWGTVGEQLWAPFLVETLGLSFFLAFFCLLSWTEVVGADAASEQFPFLKLGQLPGFTDFQDCLKLQCEFLKESATNTYKLAKEKELNLKINTKSNLHLFERKKRYNSKIQIFIFILLIGKWIYIIKWMVKTC